MSQRESTTSLAEGDLERVLIVGGPVDIDMGQTGPYDLFGREIPVIVIRRSEERIVDLKIDADVEMPRGPGPAPRRPPVPTTAPEHVEDGLTRASRRRMKKLLRSKPT